MKKIISFLLAVAMLVAFIPTAFAAENSGIRVVYDLSKTINDLGMMSLGAEFDLKTIDYNVTNGFFKFVQGTDGTHYETSGNYLGSNSGSLAYYVQRGSARKAAFAFGGNTKIAFELNVPKAGVYSFDVDYYPDNTAGLTNSVATGSSVYIYLSDNGVSTASACLIGQYKCYDANATGTEDAVTYSIPNIEIPKAGNYTVTFTTDQKDRWYRNNICGFELNGGDKLVPMISDCEISKDMLEAGESAQITAEVKKLSDGSDATGVTYSYASSDSNIAEVDENGNVTAKSIGDAEITVTATCNGETSEKVIPVSVIPGDTAGIKLTYKFTGSDYAITWKEVATEKTKGFAKLTYDVSKDLNQYYANNKNVTGHTSVQEFRGYGHEGYGMDCAQSGNWYAATIRIPVSGKYLASVEVAKSPTSGSTLGVYLIEKTGNLSIDELSAMITKTSLVGSITLRDASYAAFTWLDTPEKLKTIDVKAGEYYLVFKNIAGSSYAWFGDFHLDGFGNGTAPIITDCTAEKTELEIDETAKIATSVRYITDGNSAEGIGYTYKSSAPDVAEVSADGTITAKGAGDATITVTATATNATLPGTRTIDVTVKAIEIGEEITDSTVSVAVQTENTEKGTVSWSGSTIDEVEMGEVVTATAKAKEGYEFKYWKNSVGQVLSGKETDSFTINTNTTITAVFDKIDDTADEAKVELYNANGMPFFKNDSVIKDTTFGDAIAASGKPSYTGYAFKHWSMFADASKIDDAMPISGVVRAVAIYEDTNDTYTVTAGTKNYGNKKYGEAVTVTSENPNFSCWKLGDEIVSYDASYTFFVWGDVELTEVAEGKVEEVPIAVLDEVGGDPLLIYSVPDNYTKIEAGIIFGTTKTVTIASTDGYKAAEVRGTGQFTAQPKNGSAATTARGYIIFKTPDGETRVLYAD